MSSSSNSNAQSWLMRSTIYDRHEARRAKSMQTKGDTRHALVRVVAGLPGFRAVVPSYQPEKPSSPAPLISEDPTRVSFHSAANTAPTTLGVGVGVIIFPMAAGVALAAAAASSGTSTARTPKLPVSHNPVLFHATAANSTGGVLQMNMSSISSPTVAAKRAAVLFLGFQAMQSLWSTDRKYH